MNLPNKLTLARMIITPIFMFVFLFEALPYHQFIGLAIYVIGCITDFLDGKIARKYDMVTVFGKLADPVADKMLTTAALLVLMDMGLCNLWIVMIVLTREFAVTSVRLVASAQGVVIPANIWGKLKTASQMIFTISIMLFSALSAEGILHSGTNLPLLSNVLLGISAVLAVVSGVIYVIKGSKLINFDKK